MKEKKLNFSVSYELLKDNVIKIIITGQLSSKDVEETLRVINEAIAPLRYGHVIIDGSQLESFPWKMRLGVFKEVASWYSSHRIKHIYMVAANSFIKTLGYFAKRLYPRIGYTFYSTVDQVLEKLNPETHSKSQLQPELLKQIVEEEKESAFVKISETFKDEKGNTSYACILPPNVVFGYYTGYITKETVGPVYDFLEEHLPKLKGHWYSVLDLSKTTTLSRSGRKEFRSRNDALEVYLNKKYYCLNRTLKALLKGYSYVNKKFAESTILVSDVYKTTCNLLIEAEPSPIQPSEPGYELNEEELSKLSKDALINMVMAAYEDNDAYKKKVTNETDKILEIVSRITWDKEYRVSQMELDDFLPEFYDLAQNINRLQYEAAELIKELQYTNSNLSALVAERTREVEEKNSNTRSLLESYHSPIWLINNDYQLVDFNQSLFNLIKTHYGVELKFGQSILDSFPEELTSVWKDRYDKVLQGARVQFTESYTYGDQTYRSRITLFPIYHEEKINGCGAFVNDVSELYSYQQTLERKNEELTRLNTELDSFIYRSSHDMRAPVATLLGLVDMVKTEKDEEQRQVCFDFMKTSITRLDNFIHEITELTKNSKYDLEFKEVPMADFINEILHELAYLPKYSRVKIINNIASELHFVTDTFRLKTICKNLIANAVKYSRTDSESWVSIDAHINDNKVEISIKDNGQGIAQDEQKKVFNMFHRANTKSKGSGLGLYIVKVTVQKLGGTIDLESVEGKGTTVILYFPKSGDLSLVSDVQNTNAEVKT